MFKKIITFLIPLLFLVGFIYAEQKTNRPVAAKQAAVAQQSGSKEQPKPTPAAVGNRKVVDLKANLMYPIKVADESVICLVGDVAFYHNGAVITCDSALRYSEKRMECFGNVLINQQSAYIYCDKATYNGETNTAVLFSQIIKMIDKEASLYTYNFRYNTRTKIGEFWGGGVMYNGTSRLESESGFYNSATRVATCIDKVVMSNEEYIMRSDSVKYDTKHNIAHYFNHTHIWNNDGNYLYADAGYYDENEQLYVANKNSYVLTKNQEMWSDSIQYYKTTEHIRLYNNIQLDDSEHKVLAFGNYGEYWGREENALLTRFPSIISYDEGLGGDSLYMRADSIWLFTRPIADTIKLFGHTAAPKEDVDVTTPPANDSKKNGGQQPRVDKEQDNSSTDSAPTESRRRRPRCDADEPATESPATDVAPADDQTGKEQLSPEGTDSISTAEPTTDSVLTAKQLRAKIRAEKAAALKKKREERQEIKEAKLDSIAKIRVAKRAAKYRKEFERDSLNQVKWNKRKLDALNKKRTKKGLEPLTELPLGEGLPMPKSAPKPKPDKQPTDSLAVDSLAVADSIPVHRDSIFRIVKGYRNVRIFKSDFQAVCDSIVGISTDSTMRMYIDPIIWNEDNQMTSDQVVVYTKNQAITKADFIGKPLMISRVDSSCYNQVMGKEMTAYFADGKVTRNDVNGNARTLYYMQEDGSLDIIGFLVVDSADISFYFADKTVDKITYRGNPTYTIYPMDKIPETVDRFLPGFKWEVSRRPTRRSVFRGRIRSSDREYAEGEPQPRFRIEEQLNVYKESLISRGEWIDRDDLVQPEITEWIQSIKNNQVSK